MRIASDALVLALGLVVVAGSASSIADAIAAADRTAATGSAGWLLATFAAGAALVVLGAVRTLAALVVARDRRAAARA